MSLTDANLRHGWRRSGGLRLLGLDTHAVLQLVEVAHRRRLQDRNRRWGPGSAERALVERAGKGKNSGCFGPYHAI